VIQEIILAQDLQFISADDIISLDLFETAVNALRDANGKLKMIPGYKPQGNHQNMVLRAIQMSQIFSYRNTRLSNGYKAISSQPGEPELSLASCVVNLSSGRECKDPRDRIYAVLGFAAANLGIEPDYNLCVSCVLNDFAIRSLLTGSLLILHASGIHSGHDTSLWSFVPSMGGFMGITTRLDSSELTFSATKSLPFAVCSPTTNTVSLVGVRVDTISRCTHISPYTNEAHHSQPLLLYVQATFVSWFVQQQHLANTTGELDDLSIKILQASGSYPPYRDTSLAAVLLRTISLDTSCVSNSVKFEFSGHDAHSFTFSDGKAVRFPTNFTRPYRENRHWFQTKQGYFGLGPSWMEPDDQIVIFDGGTTPFVLRNVVSRNGEPGDTWQIVGDCFLLGWMRGDYFGHTVVDEMPPENEDDSDDKKYLVKEFFTLV
jgi:hypothetical protein